MLEEVIASVMNQHLNSTVLQCFITGYLPHANHQNQWAMR